LWLEVVGIEDGGSGRRRGEDGGAVVAIERGGGGGGEVAAGIVVLEFGGAEAVGGDRGGLRSGTIRRRTGAGWP
jgi:hypothetical protein